MSYFRIYDDIFVVKITGNKVMWLRNSLERLRVKRKKLESWLWLKYDDLSSFKCFNK